MQVRDIMSTDVAILDRHASVRDAALLMRDGGIGAVPVCDGARMLGMVTDRDIAVRGAVLNRPLGNVSIGEVMSTGVCCVRAEASLKEAERQMCEHQVRRLPVVDADNRLVGIVSLADLAKAGQQALTAEAMQAIVQPSAVPRIMH